MQECEHVPSWNSGGSLALCVLRHAKHATCNDGVGGEGTFQDKKEPKVLASQPSTATANEKRWRATPPSMLFASGAPHAWRARRSSTARVAPAKTVFAPCAARWTKTPLLQAVEVPRNAPKCGCDVDILNIPDVRRCGRVPCNGCLGGSSDECFAYAATLTLAPKAAFTSSTATCANQTRSQHNTEITIGSTSPRGAGENVQITIG